MDNIYLNLIDKMSVGQPYLFLGQEFLKNEILTDLYQKISLKFNLSNDETSNIYLELDDENRDISAFTNCLYITHTFEKVLL